MKRTFMAGTGLIIVTTIIVVGLVGLSTVFAATKAGRVNLLAPQIDVQATARAIQLKNHESRLETAAESREQAIQNQIDQTQQALDDLNRIVATQTSQQNLQRTNLQAQTTEKQQAVDNLNATATFLQQAVEQDETNHKLQLIKLQTEMEQSIAAAQAEFRAVSDQLQTAQAQRDERSPATPVPATPVLGRSAGGSSPGQSSQQSSDDSKSNDNKSDDSSHNNKSSDD